MAGPNACWKDIDPWWERYVRDQESDLALLRDRLSTLNETWERSRCLFDDDPIVGGWTETSPQDGPLRANQEENWSQWLAHLLRDSRGEFGANLLGSLFDMSPTSVRCERAYHDEELHDRRVDILGEFNLRGVTIEVKIGDEHYEKTPQTAFLTEKHHQQNLNWTHYLLLPRSKTDALRASFGDRLTDAEGEVIITAAEPKEREIKVVYWADVAKALRRTLLEDSERNSHWTASAYLFVTLVEQQILRFHALPSLPEYSTTSLGVSDVERLQSIDPDNQIEYFDEILEGITYE